MSVRPRTGLTPMAHEPVRHPWRELLAALACGVVLVAIAYALIVLTFMVAAGMGQ